MERKYFQIKMDPGAHRLLKLRAKSLGISIGAMLENLVSSLELRVDRGFDVAKIDQHLRTSDAARRIIETLWHADTIGESEKSLKTRLEVVGMGLKTERHVTGMWEPEIKLPGSKKTEE